MLLDLVVAIAFTAVHMRNVLSINLLYSNFIVIIVNVDIIMISDSLKRNYYTHNIWWLR